MKQLLLMIALFTSLIFAQGKEIYFSPVQTIIGDTAWVATVDSANQANQIGTLITPVYLKPYSIDIIGFKYPVMDSSSQFTLVMGVESGDAISSFQIFPDSVVTFTFAKDSTLAGKIFIEPRYTEIFNRFQISIPDTVDESKTFQWLLKSKD